MAAQLFLPKRATACVLFSFALFIIAVTFIPTFARSQKNPVDMQIIDDDKGMSPLPPVTDTTTTDATCTTSTTTTTLPYNNFRHGLPPFRRSR